MENDADVRKYMTSHWQWTIYVLIGLVAPIYVFGPWGILLGIVCALIMVVGWSLEGNEKAKLRRAKFGPTVDLDSCLLGMTDELITVREWLAKIDRRVDDIERRP